MDQDAVWVGEWGRWRMGVIDAWGSRVPKKMRSFFLGGGVRPFGLNDILRALLYLTRA